MPVSGHEETEFKTCAGQFSGLIAGVPIKKRRFPLIDRFSSLSGEQNSLTEETESLGQKHSSAPLGSTPTLSNAGIADAPIKKRRFPLIQASSSLEEPFSLPEENNASHKEDSSTSLGSTLPASSAGIFDENENPSFEERKTSSDLTNANFVQSKSCYIFPKREETDIQTQSSTRDIADSKEKSITSDIYEEKLGNKNSELLLAAKQSLSLDIGAEISKQNVQEKCEQESHAVLESTNLSLGFKQNLFPAVESLDVDNSFQKTEKSESFSLKLSLSKEDGSSKSHNGDAKANGANWDLNATMDAWKEPGKDATTGKTSIHGLQITDNALMEKHVMCSTGMERTHSTSLKQNSVESQNEALTILSRMHGQQHKYVDLRNLYLASCLLKYTGESSRSDKQNSKCAIPTLNPSNVQTSSGDVNIPSIRTVKSELLDENRKHDLKESKHGSVGSLDGVSVKHEFWEHSNVDSVKSPEGGNVKFHNPEFIKSEPRHEINQERPITTESISDQISKELLQGSCNYPSLEKSVMLESVPISTGAAPKQAICSTEMSTSLGIVSHLENHVSVEGACVDEKASQGACSGDKQVSPEKDSIAMVNNAKSSGLGKKDSVTNEENTDDTEVCRLKLKNEVPSDPHGRDEDGASDDYKITLSTDMLEYDSYGYDYESDAMNREHYDEEDDDFEDGEVREPVKQSVAGDSICEVREVGGVFSSNYDSKHTEKVVSSVGCLASSHLEENDNRYVNHNEINCANDGIDTESIDKSDTVMDKTMCLQESLETEMPIVGSQMRLLNLSERQTILYASETQLLSDQGNNGRNEVDAAQCDDEVDENLDIVRKTHLEMPMMEVSVNTDDANKDASNGGNKGRIINLSRASSSLSSTKSRSMPSWGLPSQAGRDVLTEKFHHDKLHGRRDDFYSDGPCRFSRERYQDVSPRNSRLNFVPGRGRINSRIYTRGGEWKSDREFYNGPRQFRGSRHKFASAAHDADPEYDDVARDGSFVGTNQLGRKPLDNEGPLRRHITLGRRSPGGRENIQMGHRIPRTMSSSRCVEDDSSEFVSMRPGEKFMRGYPQEPLDHMFTHPQPFERVNGRFTRGAGNFIRRRGPQQIRSKFPIRSRSRSPGLWSSPQKRSPRRSPDGFVGHPAFSHRRPLYRDDRMRSPDHPVFHRERVVRRHASPSYMPRPSNEMRDIGSRRGRGYLRSVISNRSPSARIMFRKRFDAVDPLERADNDEYFEGPMHSVQLLDGEGNGDERRRFNERRRPVRSFRPPYNGSVGENFHLDAEDGPRQYRYCTEDSEFQERGSLRERDFDRRIKSRLGNVPPRRRNIDEREANYRNSGQEAWSGDGFDDISRMKRKRF